MDPDGITVIDPNYREPMTDEMSRELKEYSDEKLRRAEAKENKMLEKAWQRSVARTEKRKKFFNGIKKIFARKNNEITRQTEQNHR